MLRICKRFLLSSYLLLIIGTFSQSCYSRSSSYCSKTCCDEVCCCQNGCSCDCACCSGDCCAGGYPLYSIRSQTWNSARGIVGWQEMIHQFDKDGLYGAFSVTPELTRSFKSCRIAQYLFGDSLQDGQLIISGSRKGVTANSSAEGAEGRGEKDWLADYFGLPTDFESSVRFRPQISNFIVDLDFFIGLNECWENSFFRIHAPIVHTRWSLCMCEHDINKGKTDFAMGYMDSTTVVRSRLPENFMEAIRGTATWGDMNDPLLYGKMDNCTRVETRLSDIQVEIGWNFWQCEDSHIGVGIMGAFPTGNHTCPEYLFAPVVGNGGHYELGGLMTAHGRLWTCDDQETAFDIYFEAKVAHLFKRKIARSFDLKNKPNSRYMLIQEMTMQAASNDENTVDVLYGTLEQTIDDATQSNYRYANKLLPLINISTCCTDVSIAIQGEASIKLAYSCPTECGRYSIDFGYNIWGRSGERQCGGCDISKKKYALKGDAFIFGFAPSDTTATGITANNPYALAATQSKANIHAGMNTPVGTAFTLEDRRNPLIDNAQWAWISTDDLTTSAPLNYSSGHLTAATDAQTRTSIQPIFIASEDLETRKLPSALSHKLFVHFSYAWEDEDGDDCCCWEPFLGLGGEIEFSGKRCGLYTALSQWGIWMKGGIAFD